MSPDVIALCEIELGDRKIAKGETFPCDAAQHAELAALGAVAVDAVADPEPLAEKPAKLSAKPSAGSGEGAA